MPRRKDLLAIAAALAALAVAIGLVAQYNKESRAAVQKAPTSVPVTAAPVIAKTVPVRLIAIGNVEPFTTVAVKARVDGQIVSVHFREGDEVAKGALLFEIDPRPLAATLKQAQASLLKDKALLDRAVEQEKRYKDLLQKNFISPDAYEQVKTNMDSASATVRGDGDDRERPAATGVLHDPVAGDRLRRQDRDPAGNLVKANDTNPLVTINQIVPVYASFSVPEQHIPTSGDVWRLAWCRSMEESPTRPDR
jgi:multidrug efflux system membrane fusion protein